MHCTIFLALCSFRGHWLCNSLNVIISPCTADFKTLRSTYVWWRQISTLLVLQYKSFKTHYRIYLIIRVWPRNVWIHPIFSPAHTCIAGIRCTQCHTLIMYRTSLLGSIDNIHLYTWHYTPFRKQLIITKKLRIKGLYMLFHHHSLIDCCYIYTGFLCNTCFVAMLSQHNKYIPKHTKLTEHMHIEYRYSMQFLHSMHITRVGTLCIRITG